MHAHDRLATHGIVMMAAQRSYTDKRARSLNTACHAGSLLTRFVQALLSRLLGLVGHVRILDGTATL